jgi:hypothetical protein
MPQSVKSWGIQMILLKIVLNVIKNKMASDIVVHCFNL